MKWPQTVCIIAIIHTIISSVSERKHYKRGKEMTGKEKCKLLKQIRKEIAESNGIVYLTSECTFEGECRGTCPKCDAEVRYLDNELQEKAARGEKITLSGLSLNSFEQTVAADNSADAQVANMMNPADDVPTMGLISMKNNILVEGEAETYTWRLLDMTIEELDMSVRTTNCLKRGGIYTVRELCDRTYEDILKVRNLSEKCIVEVQRKLASLGLGFKNSII